MQPPPRARSWTHAVRGLPLRVWELGDASPAPGRPPAVCLHGFLDQGLTFSDMVGARRGRWVAPDQRGFGGSGHVPAACWYHFADHIADADDLLDAVSPDAPVDLVGHSMGGTVALLLAAARPERVRRLVVLDGLGPLQPPGDTPVARMQQFLSGVRATKAHRPLASLDDAITRMQRVNPSLTRGHAARLAAASTRQDPDGLRWTYDPRHRVRAPTTLRPAELEPFLRAVIAPTLVVWAEHGFYPQAVRDRRVGWLPSARSVTLSESHMLTTAAPQAVGDLVEGFLDETAP